ncbi:MAG: hypothetical protein ACRD4S_06250 [Candidatus Acidiferrales bacterium]
MRQRKLYSYVVQHDNGHAPNPYFGVCTLCRCKFDEHRKRRNIVELADEDDWIVGTGGADERRSAGHGELVYAMRVDEKLTRGEYYADPRFESKRPSARGSYAKKRGDNLKPADKFENRKQFALISKHFFYFGKNAIPIPKSKFHHLEKKGPAFRKDFDEAYIKRFVGWLQKKCAPGKHGAPWYRVDESKGSKRCKSSCCESV